MKKIRTITATLLAISVLGGPLASLAADQKAEPKAKPYPLKTCVVTDEKLGDMGDAYAFVHQGQEIKLCCKSCLKDFNKNPAKYMKKVQEAQAKAKK